MHPLNTDEVLHEFTFNGIGCSLFPRDMVLSFNILIGLACKLEINEDQIICQMEVCQIMEGQRYSKRLNERQITTLLKVSSQRLNDRDRYILNVSLENPLDLVMYCHC